MTSTSHDPVPETRTLDRSAATASDSRVAAPSPASESMGFGEVMLTVTWEGQSRGYKFRAPSVLIGRHPSNDVTFDAMKDSVVSASHAKLALLGGVWTLLDLDSTNGVWLREADGGARRVARVQLSGGEEFELSRGGPVVKFEQMSPGRPAAASSEPATVEFREESMSAIAGRPQVRAGTITLGGVTSIGRHPSCEIPLADPQVSLHHAVIRQAAGGHVIEDQKSRNGTFVNGKRVQRAQLARGDAIVVGGRRLEYAPPFLMLYDFARGPGLECIEVRRVAGKRVLLEDVSFGVDVGAFVALLGPSGSGKSTLMKALTGYRPADRGTVRVAGSDLYRNADAARRFLAYVPQNDPLHLQLTVAETLEYAARLRLPPDFSREERRTRVERILSELELLDHRDKRAQMLSGGQRKRVSIGIELLTDPRVLFLDEPTSGLDPGMEFSMMRLARELATGGRTVVMTTHAMTNIALCDRLVFIVQGKLAFFGSPPEALQHFGVQRYESLFEVYKERTPDEWKKLYFESPFARRREATPSLGSSELSGGAPAQVAEPAPRPGSLQSLRQMWVLIARYARIVKADLWNLFSLLVVSPGIIALGFLGIDKLESVVLMFALASFWLACQNASQEVVKEQPVYRRERMVGLGVIPYLVSKFLVLSALALVQVGFLFQVVLYLKGYSWDVRGAAEVLAWSAVSGVTAGLAISAAVRTPDQAQTVVPILLIIQVVLSGAFQGDDAPKGWARAPYCLATTYWSFDALKRVAAKTEDRTRVQIEDDIRDAEGLQDRLKRQMDDVDERRETAEKALTEQMERSRSGMAPPPPGPEAAMAAVKALERVRTDMDEIDRRRQVLSDIGEELDSVVQQRRVLGDRLKDLYEKKLRALWMNHLGAEKGEVRLIQAIAALTFLLAVILLRLQDYREAQD